MRAMCAAAIALLSLLAPAAIAPSLAQSDPADAMDAASAAPLSLASLLSPQSQFPVPQPSRPFVCENAGYLREFLPLSFVADGVCDCCDGADERVAGGDNPFFPPAHHDDASQQQQAEQETHQEGASAEGGGGWLQGLLGSSGGATDSAAADASPPSPCPNTCASRAHDFLSTMQQRVDEYAAGVDAKALRMRGLGAVNKRLEKEAQALQASLASIAESFRSAKAAHARSASEQSVNLLRFLQHRGSQLQFELEHTRWLLGHAVPSPHNRQVARPPGDFGAQNEWLLLWERCYEYAWPQRRFGAFGEHVDWYLMRLCPLANATQTAMTTPPAREGSRWREAQAETSVEAGSSFNAARGGAGSEATAVDGAAAAASTSTADDASTSTERREESQQEEEEPQQWSLGWWSGQIVDEQQQQQQQDGEGGATATIPSPLAPAFSATPAGSVASSTPEPRFLLPLRGGDSCWQVGPRQVDVEVRCGRTDEIVAVREDGKCRYRMSFVTPLACSRDHLALLRAQLDAHRRWFARRPPPPQPPRSIRQMLHDEL